MRFVRNWLLPGLLALIFGFIGLLVAGHDGVQMIYVFDGVAMTGGISSAEFKAAFEAGKQITTYLSVYGLALPGTPLFWVIGCVLLFAYMGYRLGKRFSVSAPA